MLKFNILKEIQKDLRIAVINNAQNVNKKKYVHFFAGGAMLLLFVMFKPFYVYYEGRRRKILKIENLKKEGKFVLY